MVTQKKDTGLQSGFTQNAREFDGTNWVPDKVLHGDLRKTEYRNRFNQPKNFHKDSLRMSTGRLPRRKLVY